MEPFSHETDHRPLRRWASELRELKRGSRRRPALLAGGEIATKRPGHLRLLTLNIAHGRAAATHQAFLRTDTTRRNLTATAEAFRHLDADIVALQEADGPSAWSGNFDHVATLARLAELADHYRGEHNPFGVGRFNLASGTALLSRYPLRDTASRRFATYGADTKGYVVGTVELPGRQERGLDVVSVHLDPAVSRVRRRQIAMMIEELRERHHPLVVLGDLNCCWYRDPRSMDLLTHTLGLHAYEAFAYRPTYPSSRPRRRLDWILISPELEFRQYRTLATPLSDHLGVVADLRLRDRG